MKYQALGRAPLPDSDPEFFPREELLDGLPARQTGMLLFAIESRTVYRIARVQLWLSLPGDEE